LLRHLGTQAHRARTAGDADAAGAPGRRTHGRTAKRARFTAPAVGTPEHLARRGARPHRAQHPRRPGSLLYRAATGPELAAPPTAAGPRAVRARRPHAGS